MRWFACVMGLFLGCRSHPAQPIEQASPRVEVVGRAVVRDGGVDLELEAYVDTPMDDLAYPGAKVAGLAVREPGGESVKVLGQEFRGTLHGGAVLVHLGPVGAGATRLLLAGRFVVPSGAGGAPLEDLPLPAIVSIER